MALCPIPNSSEIFRLIGVALNTKISLRKTHGVFLLEARFKLGPPLKTILRSVHSSSELASPGFKLCYSRPHLNHAAGSRSIQLNSIQRRSGVDFINPFTLSAKLLRSTPSFYALKRVHHSLQDQFIQVMILNPFAQRKIAAVYHY